MQLVLTLSPGGSERLVVEICRHLFHSAALIVCCLDERGAWAEEIAQLGVPVVALERGPGFRPTLGVRIARIMSEHKVDVVHCHHYSPFVYGLLANVLTPGVRLVFTEHGLQTDQGPSAKQRRVNPWLAKWPASIYAVSAELREHMIAEGFPPERVNVVYNGVDPGEPPSTEQRNRARHELGISPEVFVIGSVGRLDRIKNLPLLLAAHAELSASVPNTQLVIVGDGPERESLTACASELGVTNSVLFTGYRNDVRYVMSAFDAYVNCSLYEGVSLTILEAMASGLPLVATRVGGNPEVVVDGETGMLVSAEATRLAAALRVLLDDPDRRRTMATAARQRVLTRFSIDRMVQEYRRDLHRHLHADQAASLMLVSLRS